MPVGGKEGGGGEAHRACRRASEKRRPIVAQMAQPTPPMSTRRPMPSALCRATTCAASCPSTAASLSSSRSIRSSRPARRASAHVNTGRTRHGRAALVACMPTVAAFRAAITRGHACSRPTLRIPHCGCACERPIGAQGWAEAECGAPHLCKR